jgi:hypothetical protein
MSVCSIAARATARQSTGSVTEPKTTETVEAKDSPLVAMAPQSADTTSSQEPGPPIPGPVTPDDQVDEEPTPEANSEEDADQLSDAADVALSEGTLTRARFGTTNTPEIPRDKRRPFRLDWVSLSRIEVKASTDPTTLMLANSLHPCAEDTLLQNKGMLPMFGMIPPQGFFKGETFAAVLDWGWVEAARRLLDAEIPVVVYCSAAAAKVSALYQLATYHQLKFTSNREGLRARIISLHTALLSDGADYLDIPSKAYLAWLAGRRESALRPSEKGTRRKRHSNRQELSAASDKPKKVG